MTCGILTRRRHIGILALSGMLARIAIIVTAMLNGGGASDAAFPGFNGDFGNSELAGL